MKRISLVVLPAAWALLIAVFLGSLLILSVGQAPLEVYRLLLSGTVANAYGIGQVLFKAAPLIFTGLSVSLAMSAGLFNVGAEGQITIGAFCAALVGAYLPASSPALVAIPLCLIAAFAGGAFTGGIAGVLKAYRGAHEVTTTIMLNFIVRAVMIGIGMRFFLRESLHTALIIESARLPRGSVLFSAWSGSALNASFLIALASAFALAWWLRKTRAGFRLRAVGSAEEVARASGIDVARTTVIAMLLSGGLSGLGGSNFVLGYKYFYEDGFSGGVGYLGIAVAVLGRGSALGVVLSALVFGLLSQGALAINALVPKEVIDVLTALVILAVAASTPIVRRMLSRAEVRA